MSDWNMNYGSAANVLRPQELMNPWGSMGQTLSPEDLAPLQAANPNTFAPLSNVNLGVGGISGGGSLFSGIKKWMDSSGMLGKTENGITTQGWGGMALGVGQGLGSALMGMKQYGLAKDSLQMAKDQFNTNFGAQQKMTNSRLEDRQRARVSSNPTAYQSVGDYMSKNGI